ncbi:hypothetical protein JRQ81_009815 [Phrynocephalus forsythii]|uniref:WD repeat-containing protein WRAP73 n=1 Tax=Phrynocephalus forsythii TaxID=171643 RepID=A0A9Q0X8W1_9SAUR|nr:hypothetical protein JRQ81_009815 [Phrynocephalus forsythii]
MDERLPATAEGVIIRSLNVTQSFNIMIKNDSIIAKADVGSWFVSKFWGSMNFSDVFKVSNQLCKFSPDGKCLASGVQYRLVIRDVNTLQILQLFTCLDQIQHVEWSSDSLFILCAMYRRGIVQVWSLEQPDWHCKIDEGSAGLVASSWSPDGRHILNTTEFHVFLASCKQVVKLTCGRQLPRISMQYIPGSSESVVVRKHTVDSCFATTILRLLKTRLCTEWEWGGVKVVAHVDHVKISFFQYKVLLYSLDGRLLSTYCAYEWSLGVKSIAWSPSSQFLAISSYDEKVRLLNHVTWKTIAELEHPVDIVNPKIVVYKEVEKSPAVELEKLAFPPTKKMAGSLFSTKSKYEIVQPPVSLLSVKPAVDRANPKIGVRMLAFSSDNCFLATRNDNLPSAVWIWDIQKMKLFVVLEHLCPVQLFQWDPRQSRLAICTGNSRAYLWSPGGCVSVQVPMEGDFQVTSLCWHSSGDAVALLSKDNFCVCYLENQEGDVK